jgi:hypothetical protein
MDWMAEGLEFEFLSGQEFFLLHIIQTGTGAHPASYPIGTEGFSPGVKRPGHEADHSPLLGVNVKKT